MRSSEGVAPWEPPAFPAVEEALAADCVVVQENGRWLVYVDVVLASGAVRRRVSEHHDERRALHAARIFERNARRCITVPQGPSRLPPAEPLHFTLPSAYTPAPNPSDPTTSKE